MTLSAWIRPAATQSGWRTIMQRETDAYFLNASNSVGPLRPSGGGTLGGNTQFLSGPTASPVSAWTHVAITYDGAALRLFINGTQVASQATTGAIQATDNPLWIGGNSPYGEYFQGLIDEVRVYNRALTQADIQADMNTGIVPTRSGHLPAVRPHRAGRDRGRPGQVNLNWTASTDNVGVTGYRVERCQGAGCTNFAQVGNAVGHLLQRHRPDGVDHLPLPGARGRRRRQPQPLLVDRHGDDAGRRGHLPAVRPHRAGRDRGRLRSGQPQLDRLHRQRRRHRLPGRALPGRGLHQLRPGRHPRRHRLQRHRPGGVDHLPLPGARSRRRRQPEPLLVDRHGDDVGRR